MDVQFELERARAIISDAVEESPTTARLQLVAAQNVLLNQDQHFARAVDDWNEITPGIVEQVVYKRKESLRRFHQLREKGDLE